MFTSYECGHVEQIATSCLLHLCVRPPEIHMTSLVTFGLILMPYTVIFTFLFIFHYGEIGMYFKSSFDLSDNKICTVPVRSMYSTSQKYSLLLFLMVLFIVKIPFEFLYFLMIF